MTALQAIMLGIVQGITEFFPISSSAHLIIIRYLFNFGENLSWQVIDISLHFGTLLAIGIYFFKDYMLMFKECLRFKNQKQEGKLFWYIVLACIPAGIAGILLDDILDNLVRDNIIVIAITLSVMGIMIYLADKNNKSEVTLENLTLKQAMLIGIGQMFAIIPGFSRSGTTMMVARMMKLEREAAAKFSFLLGSPVILGATCYSFVKDFEISMLTFEFMLGIVVSFVVGILSIKSLLKIIKKIGYEVFAVYRIVLAILIVAVYIIRV